MSDIKLDTETLRSRRTRVETALTLFQGAARVGADIAGLTGDSRLAGKVRDFADNWDTQRAALEEQLAFVRDALDAIVDVMTDLDVELADSLSQGMVDAVIPAGPR